MWKIPLNKILSKDFLAQVAATSSLYKLLSTFYNIMCHLEIILFPMKKLPWLVPTDMKGCNAQSYTILFKNKEYIKFEL